MIRCPSCGASNPEAAAWCNQCYVTPAESRPAQGPLDLDAEDSTTLDATLDATFEERPAFRRTEAGFEWACPRCGTYTSLDVYTCVECGTPITELTEAPPAQPAATNWQVAFLFSAALPGAGHMAMGRVGQGLARAVLYVLWLVSGLLALAGGGALAAVPLLLGAAALWVTGLVDLQQLRQGGTEVLTGRVLLWLVVGVIGLTLLSLFGAVPRLGGP